ncbi:MAG: hypothetical protein Q8P18_01330 [Pseudomonadota bacterium]|nr:hypothetical protein [Pseudomonadota bacterium]
MTDSESEQLAAVERFTKLRGGAEGLHRSIQAELAKERAESFARAVAKVERAYRTVAEAAAALDVSPPDERAARLARYDEQRSEALRVRWELVVHREAVGLYQQEDFDQEWPIPPRRQ